MQQPTLRKKTSDTSCNDEHHDYNHNSATSEIAARQQCSTPATDQSMGAAEKEMGTMRSRPAGGGWGWDASKVKPLVVSSLKTSNPGWDASKVKPLVVSSLKVSHPNVGGTMVVGRLKKVTEDAPGALMKESACCRMKTHLIPALYCNRINSSAWGTVPTWPHLNSKIV